MSMEAGMVHPILRGGSNPSPCAKLNVMSVLIDDLVNDEKTENLSRSNINH